VFRRTTLSNEVNLNATLADQPFFFTASTLSGGSDTYKRNETDLSGKDLVQRARREIAEIVREVAALARQPIDRQRFFAALVDRIACAIAAEGAVVWDCAHDPPLAVASIGRIAQHSIAPDSHATHVCLLREILNTQTPAVVPASPGATDANLPNNPTEFPAALVPIAEPVMDESDEGRGRYLLEVFLEDGAGVATQRGYLRFVAQMSDIASEFLRADEIRIGWRRDALQKRMMESLTQLHRLETSAAVAAEIVDTMASMFAASRVSIAFMGGFKPRLLAVSFVESIDRRGHACKELLQQISECNFPDGVCSVIELPGASARSESDGTDVPLIPRIMLRDSCDRLRLLVQDTQPRQIDALNRSIMEEWSTQSLAILTSRIQFESVPLARAYLAITPQLIAVAPSKIRRFVVGLGAVIAATLVAWMPTPMIVSVPATLRPEGTRTHYAPTDAIVESISVSHGQTVSQGDELLRLRDWAIEEQMSTLASRRVLLSQRLARSIASLVEAPASLAYSATSRSSIGDEELVQQQRLLEEEIGGLDEQIELVNAASNRLIIRADRDGKIDAWQTELTASGRPVRRGDALVRVHPTGARWMADAVVSQSRIGIVMDTVHEAPETMIQVSTVARPEMTFPAKFSRHEIALDSAVAGLSQMTTRSAGGLGMEVAIDPTMGETNRDVITQSWSYGSPATVTIDCGKRPLWQVIFFDVERAIRGTLARWI